MKVPRRDGREEPAGARRGRVAYLIALLSMTLAMLVALSTRGPPGEPAASVATGVDASGAAAPGTTRPDPTDTRPGVAIFGDSILWEAEPALRQLLEPHHRTEIDSMGGTALCDYSSQIVASARQDPTRLVVIGFIGNTSTPCTERYGPLTTPEAVAAMYADDLEVLISELQALGSPVLLVGPPPTLALDGSTRWPLIDRAWQQAASRWSERGAAVSYTDAGLAIADTERNWTSSMPCLPIETPAMGCTNGRIDVRAPDNLHFCSQLKGATRGIVARCAVWNGGAWRYAQAIADAVHAHHRP